MMKEFETTTQLDDHRDMLVVLQHTEKELLRRIEMNHQDYLYKIDKVRSEVEAEATTRLTDIRRMRTVVIALTIGWVVTTLGLIQVIQGQ